MGPNPKADNIMFALFSFFYNFVSFVMGVIKGKGLKGFDIGKLPGLLKGE